MTYQDLLRGQMLYYMDIKTPIGFVVTQRIRDFLDRKPVDLKVSEIEEFAEAYGCKLIIGLQEEE